MKEAFLHYVWNTRSFDLTALRTTDGKTVEILDFGRINEKGGPDFKFAIIILDGVRWAGNIEMHLLASEWDQHGHSGDPNYESVILHVVLEEDRPVYMGQRRLPCIEMRGRIHAGVLASYRKLLEARSWVPCAGHLASVPPMIKHAWLERMVVARLEAKSADIRDLLRDTRQDWHEVLYRLILRAFGFGVNRAAFERLARLVPYRLIMQYQTNLIRVEALLFGCAGMLNQIFIDAYPGQLQQEFFHLMHKHSLQSMQARAWEWGRVRPANFPTIRIAQLARLLAGNPDLLQAVCTASNPRELADLFKTEVSPYWQDHGHFDRSGKPGSKRLGQQSVRVVLVNAIIPFLFNYGRHTGDEVISERAVNFMADMKPEINQVTRRWEAAGMPNDTASDSQGLIHLKRTYCQHFRCTSCAIGHHLLKQPEQDTHV
ncbi:MAG: DUF2851 family protein [Saprospiraceae bacterium]|nr:DUF2851 family protein [Saprospiraceae bacterium]